MKRFIGKLNAWAAKAECAGDAAAWNVAGVGAEIARRHAPVDSGELRSGIYARRADGGAVVVSTAPHAAMVEYGTSRMAARPYMLPMAMEMRDSFGKEARQALTEVLK